MLHPFVNGSIMPAMNGWFLSAIGGLIIVLLQFIFPDIVPDILKELIDSPDSANFIGLVPFLKIILFVYYISGFTTTIVGIIGLFYTRRVKKRR